MLGDVSCILFDDSPVHMHFMGHDLQSWGEMYSHGAVSCTVEPCLSQVLVSAVLLQSLPAQLFDSGCQTTAVCTSSSCNFIVDCIELDNLAC